MLRSLFDLKTKFCLLMLLLISQNAYSYVVSSFIARKFNPETNKFHYVIMLGDAHTRDPRNFSDLQELVKLTKFAASHELSLNSIVEVSSFVFESRFQQMLSRSPESFNLMPLYAGNLFSSKTFINENKANRQAFTYLDQNSLSLRSIYDISKSLSVPISTLTSPLMTLAAPQLKREILNTTTTYQRKYSSYTLQDLKTELAAKKALLLQIISELQNEDASIEGFLSFDMTRKIDNLDLVESAVSALCNDNLEKSIFSVIKNKAKEITADSSTDKAAQFNSQFIQTITDTMIQWPDFSLLSLNSAHQDYKQGRDISLVFVGAAHIEEMRGYFGLKNYEILDDKISGLDFLDVNLSLAARAHDELNFPSLFARYLSMISGSTCLESESSARTGCAQCHSSEGKLLNCSRCRKASYCSVVCQKAHWKIHKKVCCREAVTEAK